MKVCLLVAWMSLPLAARAAETSPIERGRYLVMLGGCGDCHTPWKMGPQGPVPDEARLLSGHPQTLVMPPPPKAKEPWLWAGAATMTAFAGPWGVTYAINLTPHETGLGSWTEKMFVDSMRTGKHAGVGRPIMPPMPWQNLAKATDAPPRGDVRLPAQHPAHRQPSARVSAAGEEVAHPGLRAKLRMSATSASSTSGLPSRSGLAGIAGLRPTACPPPTMARRRRALVVRRCQAGSV